MTPKARKPLRRVSEKQARVQQELRRIRPAIIQRDGRCRAEKLGIWPEVRCWGPTDIDHWQSRGRGGELVGMSNVIALCRAHHIHKDDHPHEANEYGLWPHSWEEGELP